MRTSQYLIATTKETPADATVISHQLMLRAGLIRKLASGLYTWLPLGLRVLRKVETVVREEMNRSGAQEVLMPAVQPSELWQESGRWQQYGPELLRLNDRHGRDFCVGPTHEEVITDLARNELSSYRQLPIHFYQIQTKFRDEVRPRFGVMRAREFLMKDGYSFHLDQESLQQEYDKMYDCYHRIFSRLGLDFRAVLADTGSIGGNASHEFHVLADSGEDDIAFSSTGKYAANVELAPCLPPKHSRPAPSQALTKVHTGSAHSIEELSQALNLPASQIVKTLIVLGEQQEDGSQPLIALLLRGDHELNEIKAEKLPGIHSPLTFASDEQVRQALGCAPGTLGPINNKLPIWVDQEVAVMADFVCGANEAEHHYLGCNWERDAQYQQVVDLRNIQAGEPSPDGEGSIDIRRGIEVGHIFQLGQKYSQALNAKVLDANGREQVMLMGCYGIGVSRVVAAAIEQNHDDKGIIWPEAIAPFQVAIIPLNAHKNPEVMAQAEALYNELSAAGFEVLLDDRDKKTSPGVKFADMELMGIPHRVVISDRNQDGLLEYRYRRAADNELISSEQLLAKLKG